MTSGDATPEFVFRGKSITGAGACRLLRAIHLVREKAADVTSDEIAQLDAIREKFQVRFQRDLHAQSAHIPPT